MTNGLRGVKKQTENDSHGISCSCSRCVGLRLYPQPSLCDWCNQVHAGDANNCEEKKQEFSGLDKHGNMVPEHGSGNGNHVPDEHDPVVEWLCSLVERNIKALTRQIKKEKQNMSLKDMLDKKGGGNGNLLKGSDVPSRIKQIVIEVGAIREAPDGFNAAAIVELK